MNSIDPTSAACYTSRMPEKPENEKRIVNVTVKVYPTLKEVLEQISTEEARTLSQVTVFLIERGIACYKRDGLIREPGGLALAMPRDSGRRTFVSEEPAPYASQSKARKRKR